MTQQYTRAAMSLVVITAFSLGVIAAQAPRHSAIIISASQVRSVSRNIGQVPATLSFKLVTRGAGWRFVKFVGIPTGVKLLGDIPGSEPDGQLRPDQWYAFHHPLVLTILVESSALSPANLRFLLGRIPDGRRQPSTIEGAMKLALKEGLQIENKQQYVKLFWETTRQNIATNPQTLHFWEDEYFVPQKLVLKGDAVGWSFIRLQGLTPDLKIWLPEETTDIVTLPPGTELDDQQWCGFKGFMTLNVALGKRVSRKGTLRFYIEGGEADLAGEAPSAAIMAIRKGSVIPHGTALHISLTWEPQTLAAISRILYQDVMRSVVLKSVVIGLLILILGALIRLGRRYYKLIKDTGPAEVEISSIKELGIEEDKTSPPAAPSLSTGHKTVWKSLRLPALFRRARIRLGLDDESDGPDPSTTSLNPPPPSASTGEPPLTQQLAGKTNGGGSNVNDIVISQGKQLWRIEQKLKALEGAFMGTSRDRFSDAGATFDRPSGISPNPVSVDGISSKLYGVIEKLQTDLDDRSEQLKANVARLEEELFQLVNTVRDQQKLIEEANHVATKTRSPIAEEVKELIQQVRIEVTGQTDRLGQHIDALVQGHSGLSDRIRAQQAQLDETRQLVEKHIAQIRQAKATSATALEEHLSARLANLENQLPADTTEETLALRQRIEALAQEVAKLSDRTKNQQAELDENRRLLERYKAEAREAETASATSMEEHLAVKLTDLAEKLESDNARETRHLDQQIEALTRSLSDLSAKVLEQQAQLDAHCHLLEDHMEESRRAEASSATAMEDQVAAGLTSLAEQLQADTTEQTQHFGQQIETLTEKLAELSEKIQEQQKQLDENRERLEDNMLHTSLTEGVSVEALEDQVAAKLSELAKEVQVATSQQTHQLQQQIDSMTQEITNLSKRIKTQQSQIEASRRLLDQTITHKGITPSGRHVPARNVTDPSTPAISQDWLYTRMLGIIFAGNLEEQDGTEVEKVIQRAGSSLNQLFQEDLPGPEEIQDLNEQMKDLVATLDMLAALEAIVSTTADGARETGGNIRPLAERARRLSREIISLQGQLQNRQIELDFHVAISLDQDEPTPFLQELGGAIKQAIDKFTDPKSYFQYKLDRFMVEDVVAAADLCGQSIALPGEDQELEHLLNQLFQTAGLKPILPLPMDPFQPDEHNIVDLILGGRSEMIAHVVRRGFYFRGRLLRKADVVVYK